ncbi:MAG TPA: phytanoyl-CoA dioxygenase family protein [Acidimicrobiales bacterium]|nr:phytanoyl-CoA dioxygenase family protein [Acidimicrobiales bacterium]
MPSITTSVDDVVAALEHDGYAVVENMLDGSEVGAARRDMRRLLAGTPGGRNPFEGAHTKRVYALFAKTRAFDGPATHPLVLGVLERVLGHCQLSAPTGIEIGPGEGAQILHHDDAIYPLPRPHPEVVFNTMWALDDFTEANGATRIIPGSHRWLEPPDPDAPTMPAVMPAGSVLFYLGSVWHGGGANITDQARLGVILEYVASWLRPQENHFLAVPRAVAAQLPETLQELLGYNIYPPFMGYVDGRHPRRSLDQDGS